VLQLEGLGLVAARPRRGPGPDMGGSDRQLVDAQVRAGGRGGAASIEGLGPFPFDREKVIGRLYIDKCETFGVDIRKNQ
jgi:hypothetical protein